MSAPVIPFRFGSAQVRVVQKEHGAYWFAIRDVCTVLGIRTNDALNSLDEDEKGYDTVVSPGGPQEMGVINESGLYSLILRSRKKEAKKFKKWITSEVLPSIRKHGCYTPTAPDLSHLPTGRADGVFTSFSFMGHSLVVTSHGREPFVAMRPLVLAMGLEWPGQYRTLLENAKRWAVRLVHPSNARDMFDNAGEYNRTPSVFTPDHGSAHICIPLRKLSGYLTTLPAPEQEEMERFHNECDDALWKQWRQSVEPRPLALEEARARPFPAPENLPHILWQAQPVLCLELLAQYLGQDLPGLRKLVHARRKRFKEGVHLFLPAPAQGKKLRYSMHHGMGLDIPLSGNGPLLYTERGAALLAHLADAWERWEYLCETYYRRAPKSSPLHTPGGQNCLPPHGPAKQTKETLRGTVSLPAILRAARTRCKLSQQQLSSIIGVHSARVSEWERGVRPIPRSRAQALAHALNMPGDAFL